MLGGNGTAANPFQVSTIGDLQYINSSSTALTLHYKLMNDIDLSSIPSWTPIGDNRSSSVRFSGTFDGQGYTISNLKITSWGAYAGLFGFVRGNAVIKNLSVINAHVDTGSNYACILAAYVYENVTIENCRTSGYANGNYYATGLVGIFAGTSKVKNCYTDVVADSLGYAGGLIGSMRDSTTVQNSYANATVSSRDSNYPSGGLVGNLLSGVTSAQVTNSYYNSDLHSTSLAGTPLTTAQMKQQSSYTGWDFITTWGSNNDYPYLRVFGEPEPSANIGSVSVVSFIDNFIGKTDTSKLKGIALESYLNPVFSIVHKEKSTKKTIVGYVSPIGSHVKITSRTVNAQSRNVQSYISPIASKVKTIDFSPNIGTVSIFSSLQPINGVINRSAKVLKSIDSNISPLSANVSVFIPIRNEVITAYCEAVLNRSYAVKIYNQSNLIKVENNSDVRFTENRSESTIMKNPSSVEVI